MQGRSLPIEGQAVLRQGQPLYVVERKGQISARDRFFLEPGRAILWALLTIKDIAPVSVRQANIKTFSTTMKSQLADQFRFPMQTEFVLVNYVAEQDIDYVKEYLSDEDFIQAKDYGFQLVGLYQATTRTPLVAARYVQTLDIGGMAQPDWNPTYDNLTRVMAQSSRMAGDQIPLVETTMLRFADPSLLRHDFDYTINWENAWAYFIIGKMQGSDLGRLKQRFESMLTGKETASSLLTGGAIPGYDDCFDNMVGPMNPDQTSCFMDATLLAMFAFKNSPFYQNMIVKDFQYDPQHGTVCSDNIAQDLEIRRLIQATLREDIDRLMGGERNFNCSLLRRYLGRLCTKDGLNEDLSIDEHDPAELYGRLTNALGYYPITYVETASRASDELGTNAVVSRSIELPQVFLPSLSTGNQELTEISWPASWLGSYENIMSGDRLTFRRVSYDIRRSDCIVVHVNRRYTQSDVLLMEAAENAKRALNTVSSPIGSVPPIGNIDVVTAGMDLMSLFGLPSASTNQTTSQNPMTIPNVPSPMMSLFDPNYQPEVRPTRPDLQDQRLLNPRRLKVEHEFNVDGRGFILRAVVFSPSYAHYATYLKCGTRWFLYDDMNVQYLISQKPAADAAVQEMIETRGVLLFYYPPFPVVTQAQQQVIQQAVGNL